LREIHNKFYRLINKQVSQAANMNNGVKTPKVPESKPYDGTPNAEKFKRWLTTLLCWFRVNKYCGAALDGERVVYAVMYLEGTTLMWYDDNIDGIDHEQNTWSFKELVTGLLQQQGLIL
jgi:hypothetical protein